MHFALTRRTNYFPTLIFATCGANVSMTMFLKSRLNFNESGASSYKHVAYIKSVHYSQKSFSLCFEKLDQSKYPQKSISLNCKAETCKWRANYGWAKSNLSLRTTLYLTEKNMLFCSICLENNCICVIVRDYKGLSSPRKRNHIKNDKLQVLFSEK